MATAIVLAVYMPPQAPAPGHECWTMSSRCSSVIVPARYSPYDWNAEMMSRGLPERVPGADRAAVDHQRRPIEPRHRDDAARHVLVAAGHGDQRVVPLRAHHRLDRVGDQVARRQRVAHAVGAHRQAVADADGVEAQADQPGRLHALLDLRRPGGRGACCRCCPRTTCCRCRPAAFCRSASVRPMPYSIACDAPWLRGCVTREEYLFMQWCMSGIRVRAAPCQRVRLRLRLDRRRLRQLHRIEERHHRRAAWRRRLRSGGCDPPRASA